MITVNVRKRSRRRFHPGKLNNRHRRAVWIQVYCILTSEMQTAAGIVIRACQLSPTWISSGLQRRPSGLCLCHVCPQGLAIPAAVPRHCTAPAYCMNCQVPLSPDAPARESLRTQLRQELWAVHSCTPLPTCPFYEAGMPTPLTISFCRLALLPTEAALADGAGSVLLQL